MDLVWTAHYDPGVPHRIDYLHISLPDLFERTAHDHPNRIATVFQGACTRYGEMQRAIERFAAGLQQAGIQPGERVAIMLPNMPQYLVAFFGALRAGAVVVPTNPLYTRSELEYQLADAGAAAIVTLDPFFERVQAALPATSVRLVIVAGIDRALPAHLRPLGRLRQWRQGVHRVRPGGVVCRYEEMLAPPVNQMPNLDPEGLAVLQYTGGTTGRARGAMLSHRNLVANAMQAFHWQGSERREDVRVLCAAPFFHVYGMTVGMNLAIIAGATMLLVPRWSAQAVAKIARRYRPQLFPGVPTMYVALASLPSFSSADFGSLDVCISGAAPLPPEVQRRFQEVSAVRLVEGYGLTEASPVTHCNPVRGESRPGTVGVPFPDTEAMITDPDTWEPLPPGTVGEMTVRGPQVMLGYWRRPEETAQVLRDGWLHTGDMATMDAEGYFTVVDRKKDVIIAGGYNVYPREIEDVLYAHPAVREAGVIGVPNEYRGETVKAVVVLREGAQATAEDITAFCRQHLAAYKVPRIVEFTPDLPRSLVGKVMRRELREAHGSPGPQPVPVN